MADSRKRRGRGEGSIYFDEDKQRWVGVVSLPPGPNGKRRRRKVLAETKGKCQEELRKIQSKADKGQLTDTTRLTVEQYLRRWLETKKPTVATHTYLPYERDVNNYLVPHLGRQPLAKLAALHIEKLYADLTTAGVSPSMQRKAGTTLRTALKYAVHPLRLIPHNPADDVKKPRHEKQEFEVLDPEQLQQLLDAAREDRLYAYYVVAVDSCAREGELFALTWADVDFGNGVISITRTLEETKGKLLLKDVKTKKSRRTVALSKFSMEALADHRKATLAEGNYATDKPVFCDTQGGWMRKSNFLRRSFQPSFTRANAKAEADTENRGANGEPKFLPVMRPYDLRHTGATLLLLAGNRRRL